MSIALSPIQVYLAGALFIIITTIGIAGNAIVMMAIVCDKRMRRSAMNLLLLNLALADLLNLLINCLEWSQVLLDGPSVWLLPSILCPLAKYLEVLCLFASIQTLVTVCVERYIVIVHPIHARRLCSRRRMLHTIWVIWLIVAVFSIPYGYGFTTVANASNDITRLNCVNRISTTRFWTVYKTLECIGFYLLPCSIFLLFYSKVVYVLWQRNQQLDNYNTGTNNNNQMPENANRTYALRARRAVIKMLIVCVSVYFVCYSPIQALFLTRLLFGEQLRPGFNFMLICNGLALTSSACNPILYTLFSRKFRSRILQLCTDIWTLLFYYWRHSTPTVSSNEDDDNNTSAMGAMTEYSALKQEPCSRLLIVRHNGIHLEPIVEYDEKSC